VLAHSANGFRYLFLCRHGAARLRLRVPYHSCTRSLLYQTEGGPCKSYLGCGLRLNVSVRERGLTLLSTSWTNGRQAYPRWRKGSTRAILLRYQEEPDPSEDRDGVQLDGIFWVDKAERQGDVVICWPRRRNRSLDAPCGPTCRVKGVRRRPAGPRYIHCPTPSRMACRLC
jgi:hypothetical protein